MAFHSLTDSVAKRHIRAHIYQTSQGGILRVENFWNLILLSDKCKSCILKLRITFILEQLPRSQLTENWSGLTTRGQWWHWHVGTFQMSKWMATWDDKWTYCKYSSTFLSNKDTQSILHYILCPRLPMQHSISSLQT